MKFAFDLDALLTSPDVLRELIVALHKDGHQIHLLASVNEAVVRDAHHTEPLEQVREIGLHGFVHRLQLLSRAPGKPTKADYCLDEEIDFLLDGSIVEAVEAARVCPAVLLITR